MALQCLPCILQQAIHTAGMVTDDPAVHERVMREMLIIAAEMPLDRQPPVLAQVIQRKLAEYTGVADPYTDIKKQFNALALRILPDLRREIDQAEDAFTAAVRYAIAGNVIDFGIGGGLSEQQAEDAIHGALNEPFHHDLEGLRTAIDQAARILYLADNAGEIVLDRLLIERLPLDRLTIAVRGKPVFNDALMEDAETAGLHELAPVIDNGSDAPGTILDDCRPEFRALFDNADLIIAKGQGNFETLCDEPRNIFFLFKIKCPVVARHTGQLQGAHMAVRSMSHRR